MFRTVLVPLDGSPLGEHALPLALSIARRAGAAVELAHVHVLPAPLFAQSKAGLESTIDARAREQARAYLDGVVQRLAGAKAPVTSVLLEGGVADCIEERVQARGVGLVVLTTHGRGLLSRFWLGSVADQLVRRLTTPLLVVRPKEGSVDFTAEPTLRHVLLPLDGSPLAEQAVEPVLALGRLLEAEYTLLRVVEPLMVPGYGLEWSGALEADVAVVRQLEEEARAYLERVAKRVREQGCKVRTRVVVHPQPASAILEEAQGRSADLIGLATHGRGGVKRLLLGSVADKVLRGATTPVLVCRPPAET